MVFDRSKGLKMTNHIVGQFGDTTLTKVFVGGLAWETRLDAITDHFHKYGEILEAVIISDKSTGRSKGYGFVSFHAPPSQVVMAARLLLTCSPRLFVGLAGDF